LAGQNGKPGGAGKNDDLQGQCTQKVLVMAARQIGLQSVKFWACPPGPAPEQQADPKLILSISVEGLSAVTSILSITTSLLSVTVLWLLITLRFDVTMLKYDVVMLKYDDSAFSKTCSERQRAFRARAIFTWSPYILYDIQAKFLHTLWATFSNTF
jgi:hypothetical protein